MVSISRVLVGRVCVCFMSYVNTPHNYHCPSIPSTQLFIVDPNSKISTNILRINVMLPGKMGHHNRVVVCHLISFTVRDARVWRRKMASEAGYITCVTQRGFPRKHHGAPLLLHLDRVTRAARFELGLQLRQCVPRGRETS